MAIKAQAPKLLLIQCLHQQVQWIHIPTQVAWKVQAPGILPILQLSVVTGQQIVQTQEQIQEGTAVRIHQE